MRLVQKQGVAAALKVFPEHTIPNKYHQATDTSLWTIQLERLLRRRSRALRALKGSFEVDVHTQASKGRLWSPSGWIRVAYSSFGKPHRSGTVMATSGILAISVCLKEVEHSRREDKYEEDLWSSSVDFDFEQFIQKLCGSHASNVLSLVRDSPRIRDSTKGSPCGDPDPLFDLGPKPRKRAGRKPGKGRGRGGCVEAAVCAKHCNGPTSNLQSFLMHWFGKRRCKPPMVLLLWRGTIAWLTRLDSFWVTYHKDPGTYTIYILSAQFLENGDVYGHGGHTLYIQSWQCSFQTVVAARIMIFRPIKYNI